MLSISPLCSSSSAFLASFCLQLVRLVANLSVSPEVGPAIASSEASVNQLLRILGKCKRREIVYATIASCPSSTFLPHKSLGSRLMQLVRVCA